jgi:hypothetical protein
MRSLPLLLVLLLASFGLAATARAMPLPVVEAPLPLTAVAAEEEPESTDEGNPAEEETEIDESCGLEEEDEEEEQACAEELLGEEEDECVLESADASVTANPASGKVRVRVRYTASSASTFALDYSLRGGKGELHLGSARAQFHRAGVFHDTLSVGGGKLAKLAAAHRFEVDLHAVGTPGYCREDLTEAAPRRAKRRHRAGA